MIFLEKLRLLLSEPSRECWDAIHELFVSWPDSDPEKDVAMAYAADHRA